jgi:hypothetical protein
VITNSRFNKLRDDAMKGINTETETVSLSLSISDNTEFKKNGSVLGDISFELCTNMSKFTKKSNIKYNKNVQEIPFHHEVNTGTRQNSRDLPPLQGEKMLIQGQQLLLKWSLLISTCPIPTRKICTINHNL